LQTIFGVEVPDMNKDAEGVQQMLDKLTSETGISKMLDPNTLKKKIIETLEEEDKVKRASTAQQPVSSEDPAII
jgi:hypothetical protein